ncbi:MAG: peptide methionine sulfoxide reductase [Candidatus Harrisonbacteria bacterium CG10_big_fil_rev_8_21_14_0_10_42_17]|uniref:Peptide methionine sulfoxide reductase n=1 Tax=Candidatus Harrisonbacteria bacterium CG10_big_fil_rev_8_21_14_0_10_42_17 TaxID=1974584 RepID=A0A2M6WH40_9BACT|nr:MAG: peptide methionine sulfoxide reductase [Candidatus Harrisonbacteria bacterium CG10_big_fil_rev_8_21_14_0_10_42_17]
MNFLLKQRIQDIPVGYSEALYCGKKYGLMREDFANSHSIKIFAKEQGGDDIISFNYYQTDADESYLRPCEMPDQKVLDFVEHFILINTISEH